MFYFYWNKFFPDIFAFFAPPRFFIRSVSLTLCPLQSVFGRTTLYFSHSYRYTCTALPIRCVFFSSVVQCNFFHIHLFHFFHAHIRLFSAYHSILYMSVFFSSSLSRVVCALDFYICPVDFGMCWFMCANAQFGIIITMMENKAAITKMSTNNDYTISLSNIAQAMATPADQKQQQ